MGLLGHTLRSLAAPRRAMPLALVCLPLMALDVRYAGTGGFLLGGIVFAGFLATGPVAYRALYLRDTVRSGLARAIAFASVDLLYVALFGSVLPRLLGLERSIFADSTTLYSAVPLFWAGSWALGSDIEWETRLHAAEARNEALAREAERAQLLALRTHLDPHFLFNTLNAIAEWCREDPAVAERATLQLSAMLRTILVGVKASAWPLREELDLTRQLLELHRTRDPARFAFDLDAAADATPILVPPMIVLSLAENAVKHGPAAGHAGRVVVRAARAGEHLQVIVENPGPFTGRRPGAEGLSTIDRRLDLAYGGRATMRHDSDGVTTRATLLLPLRPDGEAT